MGKTGVLGKNLSEQGRPTTNSTHIWRRSWDLNQGHIGEGDVRVFGDAVLLHFWCDFAVIFIVSCGIVVFQSQAVCGI